MSIAGPTFAMRCVRPKSNNVVPLKYLEKASRLLILSIKRHYAKRDQPWDLSKFKMADISIHFTNREDSKMPKKKKRKKRSKPGTAY